jgi:hypothetical protein
MKNQPVTSTVQTAIDAAAKDLVRELVIDGLRKELAVNSEMREIVRTEIIRMCNGNKSALKWLANDGLNLAIAYLRFLEGEQKTRLVFSGPGVGR